MIKQSSRREASSFIWHEMAHLYRLSCLISPFIAAEPLLQIAVGYLIFFNIPLIIFLYLQLLLSVLSDLCIDVTM